MGALGLVGGLLLAACSATTRYEVLSFFFDGVPDPSAPPPPPKSFGPDQLRFVYTPPPADPATVLKMHQPYKEHQCDACHRTQQDRGKKEFSGVGMVDMAALKVPVDKLCFTCHQPSTATWQHAPALLGDCVRCHHPHASMQPRLLLRPKVADLCAPCHTPDTLLTAEKHASYGTRDCADCHDPHASEVRYLLKQGWEQGPVLPPPPSGQGPQPANAQPLGPYYPNGQPPAPQPWLVLEPEAGKGGG